MLCERYANAIQELADGTLGPIRRAELQVHLDECAACRRLADDLVRIHTLAESLDRPAPPDRLWPQIARRLRQEGRIIDPPAHVVVAHRFAPLALAASLLLIVGASLYVLYPSGGQAPVQQTTGNAPATDPVEPYRSVEAELESAEQAIARLQQAAKGDGVIDPETAAELQKNLEILDQAIAQWRGALRTEPQSAPARNGLFDALRRKVAVLQDTIALMNLIRKGDAAGAAEIVEGGNKS